MTTFLECCVDFSFLGTKSATLAKEAVKGDILTAKVKDIEKPVDGFKKLSEENAELRHDQTVKVSDFEM